MDKNGMALMKVGNEQKHFHTSLGLPGAQLEHY